MRLRELREQVAIPSGEHADDAAVWVKGIEGEVLLISHVEHDPAHGVFWLVEADQ